MRWLILLALASCNDSGGADSGAPPQCDSGNCSCTGTSCNCPAGTGCEFQCNGACQITCTGPCVVHCPSGSCTVKCGGAMPAMCGNSTLVCNKNCPP